MSKLEVGECGERGEERKDLSQVRNDYDEHEHGNVLSEQQEASGPIGNQSLSEPFTGTQSIELQNSVAATISHLNESKTLLLEHAMRARELDITFFPPRICVAPFPNGSQTRLKDQILAGGVGESDGDLYSRSGSLSNPGLSNGSFSTGNSNSLISFMERFYANNYKVYNLCGEKKHSDCGVVFPSGKEKEYPVPPNSPLPLAMAVAFCVDLATFLQRDPANIAVVHCSDSGNRTGCAVACALLYTHSCTNSAEALTTWYQARRHSPKCTPSQVRFVGYFQHWLQQGKLGPGAELSAPAVVITNMSLWGPVPQHGIQLFLVVTCEGRVVFNGQWGAVSSPHRSTLRGSPQGGRSQNVAQVQLPCGATVAGTFHIMVYEKLTKSDSSKPLFGFWMHTLFMREPEALELNHEELDVVSGGTNLETERESTGMRDSNVDNSQHWACKLSVVNIDPAIRLHPSVEEIFSANTTTGTLTGTTSTNATTILTSPTTGMKTGTMRTSTNGNDNSRKWDISPTSSGTISGYEVRAAKKEHQLLGPLLKVEDHASPRLSVQLSSAPASAASTLSVNPLAPPAGPRLASPSFSNSLASTTLKKEQRSSTMLKTEAQGASDNHLVRRARAGSVEEGAHSPVAPLLTLGRETEERPEVEQVTMHVGASNKKSTQHTLREADILQDAKEVVSKKDQPVSIISRHCVLPDRLAQYEKLVEHYHTECRSTVPGHTGCEIIHPNDTSQEFMYTVVFKFDRYANLETWVKSRGRAEFIAKLSPLIDREKSTIKVVGSLLVMLESGSPAAEIAERAPPPKWKFAFLVWVSVMLYLVPWMYVVQPHINRAGLSFHPSLLIGTCVSVPFINYLALPILSRVSRTWLVGDICRCSRRPIKSKRRRGSAAVPKPKATGRGCWGCNWLIDTLEHGLPCIQPYNRDAEEFATRLEELERKMLDGLQKSQELNDRLLYVELAIRDGECEQDEMVGEESLNREVEATMAELSKMSIPVTGAPSTGRSGSGVTVIIRHAVKPRYFTAYEQWTSDIYNVAQQVSKGHLGTTLIRPVANDNTFTVIFKYDTLEHLHDWLNSSTRRHWLGRVQGMVEGVSVHIVGGSTNIMEALFVEVESRSQQPQNQWKLAIITFIALYLVMWPINLYLGGFLAQKGWPVMGGATLCAVVTVVLVSYISAPLLGMWLEGWLQAPWTPSTTPVRRCLDLGFPCLV